MSDAPLNKSPIEEFETSREELQAMNEKLKMVNDELRNKIIELESANNDLVNLINSTDVAVVFMDANMEIRRFTPAAEKFFNLIPSDIGRPIGDLSTRFNDNDLQKDAARVMKTLEPSVKEVSTDKGSWYIRRILPFRTPEMVVHGLLLTLSDVTDLKDEEISEKQYRELMQTANSIIIRWDREGVIRFINNFGMNFFGYSEEELVGKDVMKIVPKVEESSGRDLAALVKDIVLNPLNYTNVTSENITKDHKTVWVNWTNKAIFDDQGNVKEILAVGNDITDLMNMELALTKSENEKRLILDNADEIIAYHDRENNLVWANRAFQERTGISLSELKGKKCFHCWNEESLCDNCPVIIAMETGKPQRGEITPENQSNWPEERGSWEVRSAPVKDNEGNIIGAIEVARDISEQKKIGDALRALSYFPEENPNPVMRFNTDGDILYANNPAQEWLKDLGWHSEQPPPDSLHNLVKSASEKARPVEIEIASPKGQVYNTIAIRPSDEKYVNIYSVDVTERKKAEKELQNMNEILERKVMERTAELEWRNRELQEFAYVASHDLQEPLRKIKLFEEMLEKESKEGLTEQGHDYLRRMNQAADRMQKLIKSLLTYSRSSSNTVPFERVDLNPIVETIARDLLPEDVSITPEIEITELPVIDADPVQMHQLFQNILANAVRYHREGQVPRVRISSRIMERDDKLKNKFCELTVEDNGIGFDMAHVNKIFSPFERLHPHSMYEGTGMGLAICRKIVERHGGRITARSVPGEGAAFIVILPMSQINGTE